MSYMSIMGMVLQASAMSDTKGSVSIPFSWCFFMCFFSAALLLKVFRQMSALGSHGGFQTLVFPHTSNKFYLAVCHFINTL